MPLRRTDLLPPDLPAERLALCVGLVSDTHLPQRLRRLPASLFDALAGVDLLLHAGDVGELGVLDALSALAPVVAVHGNDDTEAAQRELPYSQVVALAGRRLLLCHSHHPDRAQELAQRAGDAWAPKLNQRALAGAAAGASIVVFGHTHIPMAVRHNGCLLVNPGAIAPPNARMRQTLRTVALLAVRDDGAVFVVHVDLDALDRPYLARVDLAAGFRAAAAGVNSSLLAPDLAAVMADLEGGLDPAIRAAARDLLLPLAWRCWEGRQEQITRADLAAAIKASHELPAAAHRQLLARLVEPEPT
jgi:hypothetical protein